MKVWIFVAIMNWYGTEVHLADGIKYAFLNKATCEYAIANEPHLKCIELELKE